MVAEIINYLESLGASTRGDENTLRDRLVRGLMINAQPDNDLVPQYPWDISVSSSIENMVDTDNIAIRETPSREERIRPEEKCGDNLKYNQIL